MLVRVVCERCKKNFAVKAIKYEDNNMVMIIENCNSARCVKASRYKREEIEYEKILTDLVCNQTYEESPFERLFDKINFNEYSY